MDWLKGKDKLGRRANRRIYGLVLALIACVVALGTIAGGELRRTGREIEVGFGEQQALEELQVQFDRVVMNVRGYIAYGNTGFLQDVEVERVRFENRLATADSDTAAMEEIATLWREYDGLIDEAVGYKAEGDADALSALSRERTTPAIDRINALIEELLSEKEKELRGLMEESRRVSERLIWGVLVFAVLMFGWVAVSLHRFFQASVIQPLSVLGRSFERLSRGVSARLPDDYRDDEIGAVYRGFNFMTGELERRQDELEQSNAELAAQRDELEAQNEEIMAQQEEQERTLRKLTERERDLELLTRYQERLTGFTEMETFLEAGVSAMLNALGLDAALVVHRPAGGSDARLLHAVGYPATLADLENGQGRLYGPADRVFRERTILTLRRPVTGDERGLHRGYEEAVDHYCPLLDDELAPIGFLLLTGYGSKSAEPAFLRVIAGVAKQFSIAFHAQLLNEDRRRQAAELETLNVELEHEQQRLRSQRDLVQGIVQSIHEGLIMCDYGIVRFANPTADAFFGMAADRGAGVAQFCERLERGSDGTLTGLYRKLTALQEGAAEELHARFSYRPAEDSALRHYELHANVLESGASNRQLLLVFRDRTEEEKADEAKNEFVSIVSHELRTPLSSIMGFMEILLHREVAKEKQRKYLETVYKESQRLSHLIGDFLDLQRMESGKQTYHLTPIAVEPWLRELVEGWKGQWPHRIELRLETDAPYVVGDADRLTQVMHNLISNAMKYSPGQDRIVVRVRTEGERCVIDVTDFGLGIPEEAKPKLFTKFYRVDNSDRRQIGGTGLGLSVVKEIVEAHEGAMSFDSELGAGSTFTVSLPLYEVPSVEGRVVVVEDDTNASGLIAVAFEKLGLSIRPFATAEAAALALRRSDAEARPALCIVDVQLGGRQSGWDFLAEIRETPAAQDVPIVLTTVLDPPQGFHETPRMRYLRKPFTVERLLQVAKQALDGEPL
ncbi:response regulator [Paenibacillus antri]|uniref:histidine kinase n=1 Tax=Paenibacillus antri TaxID=2582848 RepID=A0A5R9G4Z8_9BACL|nr:ATP-binding protein [Paenibacillus antri]TLS51432.1 response regulator [Paenibacillus antri]